MSEGILQEIKAVWKGHSLEINACIRDVKALERALEVCMPFRDLAFPKFIKSADKLCKNPEGLVSFMEVTAILNAYQKIHNLSLSCLIPPPPLVSSLCIFPIAIAIYSVFFFFNVG